MAGTEYFDSIIEYALRFSLNSGRAGRIQYWQAATALSAKYGAARGATDSQINQYIKRAIVDILSKSVRIQPSIADIITARDIYNSRASSEVWNWFLMRYVPESYDDLDVDRYYLHDIYGWIDAPYNYDSAESTAMSFIMNNRGNFSSPERMERELREFSKTLGQFDDVVDLWKSKITNNRLIPQVKPSYIDDDWYYPYGD